MDAGASRADLSSNINIELNSKDFDDLQNADLEEKTGGAHLRAQALKRHSMLVDGEGPSPKKM